jgi:ribosomal protein S18 acetylase RimI-like enzyme
MIIRLATETDDIQACAAMGHSYVTDHVWQVEAREHQDGTSVAFRTVHLPRTLRDRSACSLDKLGHRWNQGDAVLVAEDEGQIVGYLYLTVQDKEGIGWVHNLVVTPRLRRRGIGTALVQAAADWLCQRNVRQLSLEMTTKNYPAICFAQKLGFSFCGYNDRYYASQDIAIFFAKALR